MPSETHRGEAVIGNAGNTQSWSDFGIVGDVILVVEAVVTKGKLIHVAAADGPGMRNANLRTTNDLALDGVHRLPGERREGPAVVAVVAISMIPSKRSP